MTNAVAQLALAFAAGRKSLDGIECRGLAALQLVQQ
jgi:hypothetical protein